MQFSLDISQGKINILFGKSQAQKYTKEERELFNLILLILLTQLCLILYKVLDNLVLTLPTPNQDAILH